MRGAIQHSPLRGVFGLDLVAQMATYMVADAIIAPITDIIGTVLGVRKRKTPPGAGFKPYNRYQLDMMSGSRHPRSEHLMLDGVVVSGQNLSDFGSGYHKPQSLQTPTPTFLTNTTASLRSNKTSGLVQHLHDNAMSRKRSIPTDAPMPSSVSMCC